MNKEDFKLVLPEIKNRLKNESVRSIYEDLTDRRKISVSLPHFYKLVATAVPDEDRKLQPVLQPDHEHIEQVQRENRQILRAINTRMETLTRALDEITGKFPDADALVQGVEKAARQAAGTAVNPLGKAADDLYRALTAVQSLRETHRRLRWGKYAITGLVALLMLLSGFMGGVVYTRSGLTMRTETGCIYLGGTFNQTETGSSLCWYETP